MINECKVTKKAKKRKGQKNNKKKKQKKVPLKGTYKVFLGRKVS